MIQQTKVDFNLGETLFLSKIISLFRVVFTKSEKIKIENGIQFPDRNLLQSFSTKNSKVPKIKPIQMSNLVAIL